MTTNNYDYHFDYRSSPQYEADRDEDRKRDPLTYSLIIWTRFVDQVEMELDLSANPFQYSVSEYLIRALLTIFDDDYMINDMSDTVVRVRNMYTGAELLYELDEDSIEWALEQIDGEF